MLFLTAAVILVGALCVFDLLLSFGIIRRLREQNETLSTMRQQQDAAADPDVALLAGARVGEFAATAVSGVQLSDADLTGERALVGLFSPGCEPCKERIPQFIEYATRFEGRVIAVTAGAPDEVADMVVRLGEVAEVVVESGLSGAVHKAFGVQGYPALCLVDEDRTVVASGWQMSALPVPATL